MEKKGFCRHRHTEQSCALGCIVLADSSEGLNTERCALQFSHLKLTGRGIVAPSEGSCADGASLKQRRLNRR